MIHPKRNPPKGYKFRVIGYNDNNKVVDYDDTHSEVSAKECAAKMVLGEGYTQCSTAAIHDIHGTVVHSVSRVSLQP